MVAIDLIVQHVHSQLEEVRDTPMSDHSHTNTLTCCKYVIRKVLPGVIYLLFLIAFMSDVVASSPAVFPCD